MQRLNALLQQATQDGTTPGAVICVGYQGQLVWHQAYGLATTIPHPRPMQRETLFDIASLTKVIATTSLMLWAQHEGRCTFDNPLQHFYPQLPSPGIGAITLRQLLTHTGGLTAWYPFYQELIPESSPVITPSTAPTRRRQVLETLFQLPLETYPGSQVVYSDLGFIILGMLLEKLYDQSLAPLFLDKVVNPLGLESIAYRPLGESSPLPHDPDAYASTEVCEWRGRVLTGEVHDETAWAMGGVAGHAGLFATTSAVWHFAQSLLDTVAGTRQWLPPTLLQASWEPQTSELSQTRALGWDTPTPGRSTAGDYFSPQSIGHLGFTGTSMWIDPTKNVIVILCTNRVHPTRHTTGIRRLRPAVHNLVMHALGVTSS